MFGTLQCNVPRQEPLKFVSASDPTWASTRTKREKPRTSCKPCQQRKVRCDGNPRGCSSCRMSSTQCHYSTPAAEKRPRKGKPSHSRSDVDSPPPRPKSPAAAPPIADKGSAHYGHTARAPQEHQVQASAPSSIGWRGSADLKSELHPTCEASPAENDPVLAFINDPTFAPFEASKDVDFWDPSAIDSFAWDSTPFQPPLVGDLNADPVSSTQWACLQDGRDGGKARPQLNHGGAATSHQSQPANGTSDTEHTFTVLESQKQPQSPASSDRSSSARCQCLQRTASLLDELGTKVSNKRATIDVLLHHLRKALAHCNAAMTCTPCATLSENTMLLAMTARYMSNLCERIATSYVALMHDSEGDAPKPKPPRKASQSDEEGFIDETERDHAMWFDSYRVESCREMKQVLRCIVSVNLHEFIPLLDRIKERSGNRAGCLEILEAERRIKSVKSMLSHQNLRLL